MTLVIILADYTCASPLIWPLLYFVALDIDTKVCCILLKYTFLSCKVTMVFNILY